MKNILPGIHREGFAIIFIFVIVTILLYAFSSLLGALSTILTTWCICFFRDPNRVTPQDSLPPIAVSPADGIVQNISEVIPSPDLNLGNEIMQRVSIFLSIFDVHVNRMPVSGKIVSADYRPGKFINASLDKASEDNERQSLVIQVNQLKTPQIQEKESAKSAEDKDTEINIEMNKKEDQNEESNIQNSEASTASSKITETEMNHQKIGVVQIAGMIARRIVCDVGEGHNAKIGERFGIIRFGSRVDLYLPKDSKIKVLVGQKTVGGETIIASLYER